MVEVIVGKTVMSFPSNKAAAEYIEQKLLEFDTWDDKKVTIKLFGTIFQPDGKKMEIKE